MKTRVVTLCVALLALASSALAQDQYALNQARFTNNPPGIAGYPMTAHITKVRFFPGRGWTVEFDRRVGPDAWPSFITPGWGGPLQYTLGICRLRDFLCSATIEFWQSRLDEAPPNGGYGAGGDPGHIDRDWFYDGRWGDLAGWQPAMGEQVAVFIVGGDARGQTELPGGSTMQHRTNAVVVSWGQDWDAPSLPTQPQQPSEPPVVVSPGQPPRPQPQPGAPVDMSSIRDLLLLTASHDQMETIFTDLVKRDQAREKQIADMQAEIDTRIDRNGLETFLKDKRVQAFGAAVLGFFSARSQTLGNGQPIGMSTAVAATSGLAILAAR